MRRLALAILFVVGCHKATSPHAWTVRTDIDRIPHSYFYCTAHDHEPRDAAERAEAEAWYAVSR